MMKKGTFLIVVVLLCILIAPLTAVTAQDTAHVRFGHFVFNGPQVNLFVDKDIFNGEDGKPYGLNALELSRQYLEVSAGTPHTFVVTEAGKPVDTVLFKSETFTLQAKHNYTLMIRGNVALKDLHFTLLDETDTLAKYDTKVSAVSILFNDLFGLPTVDFYWADKKIVDNLAYGDYAVVQDPTSGKGSYLTPHGDAKTKIFEYADAIAGPPQTLAYFGFVGKYPGVLGEDFTTPYLGNFIGTPTSESAGSIAVGDTVKVNLNEAGLRYDYKLVLDKDSTLDIFVKGGAPDSNTDAYLRVFDAKGGLVAENDDLDHAVGRDAGVKGLKLAKGTYEIEAATYFDTFVGDYTLSIQATK